MRLGVQMFGVKDIFLRDPESFFQQIHAMGYTLLEPIVTFENIEWANYFAWKQEQFDQYRELCARYHITVLSAFAFVNDWSKALPGMISLVKNEKLKHMVIPCPLPADEAELASITEELLYAGKQLQAVGCKLLLHNDASVISKKINGKPIYKVILERCLGGVHAQLDVGYVVQGKENVAEILQDCKPYILSIHYKDGTYSSGSWQEKGIGTGDLKVSEVVSFAKEYDLPQIMDQDSSEGDFMEDLKYAAKMLYFC